MSKSSEIPLLICAALSFKLIGANVSLELSSHSKISIGILNSGFVPTFNEKEPTPKQSWSVRFCTLAKMICGFSVF